MNTEKYIYRLKEVANIGAGNSAPQNKELFKNGIYPFIRTSDVGKIHLGSISESRDKLNEEGIKGLKFFKKGTILFPKSGASTFLNHRVIMEIDGYVASHLATIKAKEDLLDDRYLLYFLQTLDSRSLVLDSDYPSLKLVTIQDIELYLPPLSVQKKIVEKLDAAFADIDKAISATEKNIENAESMASIYSQDVFNSLEDSFQTISLDQVCVVDRGSSPRPIKKFITNESTGINWIKIGDIAEGDKYVVNTKQKITIEGSKKSRKVEKGDLILTNSMSYGRPYIMAIDGCIHDGWFVLRLKEGILTDYFFHLMSSPFVQKQFHSLAAGAVVKNISGDLLKKTKVIIPSIKKQTETIERLEKLSKEIYQIKEIYNNKLKNLTALKSSILNKAFSGELTKDAA